MEETPARSEWIHKNRKPIAVIIIMVIFIPSAIVISNVSNYNRTEYELSYSLTIWISPQEEEFAVYLSFYMSQQNAEEQVDLLQGLEFNVQPADDEEHDFILIDLPEGIPSFWVRICFDSSNSEIYTILNAGIGQTESTSLFGHEIRILVQPYQGWGS